MSKRDLAEFLATISARTNTTKTKDEWVKHYMTFSESELQDEYNSYMC